MKDAHLALALLSFTVLACSSAPDLPDRPDHKPFFNGHDLDGWVQVNCAASTWSVRDGMILCTGKPTGVLRSERQYQDFVLECEWRHMRPGGNAGIFVWSDALPARGRPFTRSIEVQVMDGPNTAWYTTHGDVFAIHGAEMTPDRPHPRGLARCLPSEHRSRPAGEWNHYRITCRDGSIKLAVNGKEVSGGYDITPRKGYICLESEGSEVHFRSLRLMELPPRGDLRPVQVAEECQGHSALFHGLDLSGFQAVDESWQAQGWRLLHDGSGEVLWTEDSFRDCELRLDYKLAKRGPDLAAADSGIRFAGSPACSVSFTGGKRGQWHRLVVTRRAGELAATRDGLPIEVERSAASARRGRIGLAHRGRPVEFANFFVREF